MPTHRLRRGLALIAPGLLLLGTSCAKQEENPMVTVAYGMSNLAPITDPTPNAPAPQPKPLTAAEPEPKPAPEPDAALKEVAAAEPETPAEVVANSPQMGTGSLQSLATPTRAIVFVGSLFDERISIPRIGQEVETRAGAEVGEVGAGFGVVGAGEVGGESGDEGRGVEKLAESGDAGGLATGVVGTFEHLIGASEQGPRLPVVGQVGERGFERGGGAGGVAAVFEIPAACEPMIACVPVGLGPAVEEALAAIELTGIGQSGDERLACQNLMWITRNDRIKR